MGKIVARNADVFVQGRDISGQMNQVTLSLTAEAPDVTSFGDDDRTRLADTLKDAELSVNGFWNSSASNVDELFSSVLGASAFAGFYPESASSGYSGREFRGVMTDYNTESSVPDATGVSATISGSSNVHYGNSLGYTTFSGTASGALGSVDFTANSASVVVIWRVLEYGASATGVSASYQHSNDDASFTTLIDMGTITGPNESACQSATSACRYRRLKYVATGSAATATIQAFSGSIVG